MSTLHRAQILLESEQHQALTRIARQQGCSLSELVREIVREHLAHQSKELQLKRELEALDALTRVRRQIHETHGFYSADLIAEAREERVQDMERVWSDRA
ncbi:MAG: ribbon-helix-helix domain-containing protein [Anaerolineae bacterium]|nr:ribbon-helix-helix domain-containing protein [Anaerolineae bacterium]